MMRQSKKWLLLASITLLSLWAVAQVTVTNELFPWVADNGAVVWQELLAPRRTDLFQVPVTLLPASNVGVRAIKVSSPIVAFVLPNPPILPVFAGRPQISADGSWLIYYDSTGQVYAVGDKDGDGQFGEDPPGDVDNDGNPDDNNDGNVDEDWKLISYKLWVDTNDDNIRDAITLAANAILPAINGSGRIVVFLSEDPAVHDPDGDGNPANNTPPNPGAVPPNLWIIYIHDRDADGNGTFDEARVGATTTRFLPNPANPMLPLFVRLTEVRLSLDTTGRLLAFSVFTGVRWELYIADWQGAAPPMLVAASSVPFSVPTVSGSQIAFNASSSFSVFGAEVIALPPGVWVLGFIPPQPELGLPGGVIPNAGFLTNGVNGAPVLSRDGTLLAFHSTATSYGFWSAGVVTHPRPFDDRNGVDDVFVFDINMKSPKRGLLVWTTLALRQVNPAQFPQFIPCVNPSLSSQTAGLIAFQQVQGGSSFVRVVNMQNNGVLR